MGSPGSLLILYFTLLIVRSLHGSLQGSEARSCHYRIKIKQHLNLISLYESVLNEDCHVFITLIAMRITVPNLNIIKYYIIIMI